MKKIMIMLICMAGTLAVFSQDSIVKKGDGGQDEMHTLFSHHNGSCNVPLGYFFEINGGYTKFGNYDVFLPGLSMGLILNHHWTIGATGSFIGNYQGLYVKDVYFDSASMSMHSSHLYGGYGGLLLEYTLFPNSRVHVAFPLTIGGGYMYYSNQTNHHDSAWNNHSYHHHHNNSISSDGFFVIEPGVRVECNVVKHLRIGLTVSYRYVPDLVLKNTSSDFLNQFTAKLAIRLGKF